jgi:uncharacterized membrane protein YhaH (DUF805 family)
MENSFAAPPPSLAKPRSEDSTYDPSALALSGRLGRIRYFVYATTASLAGIALLAGLVGASALASDSMPDGPQALIVLAIYGCMLFSSMVLARPRVHDMDQSSWLALLLVAPIVNVGFGLWLMFAPGTTGKNRFGPAPSPNPGPMISAAWIVGVVLFALFTCLLFLPGGPSGP